MEKDLVDEIVKGIIAARQISSIDENTIKPSTKTSRLQMKKNNEKVLDNIEEEISIFEQLNATVAKIKEAYPDCPFSDEEVKLFSQAEEQFKKSLAEAREKHKQEYPDFKVIDGGNK